MKPRYGMCLLTLLLSLVFAAQALALDEIKLRAETQALFDQAAAGFMQKDLKAVLTTSAPGAVIKYKDGRTMDMTQWEEATVKEMADWQDIKSKYTVEKAWPKGKGKAGALYRERHDFTLASDPGHKHAVIARLRTVLTRTAEGWRFLEFQELSTTLTRDGKPVKPQAAPAKPAKAAKTQG